MIPSKAVYSEFLSVVDRNMANYQNEHIGYRPYNADPQRPQTDVRLKTRCYQKCVLHNFCYMNDQRAGECLDDCRTYCGVEDEGQSEAGNCGLQPTLASHLEDWKGDHYPLPLPIMGVDLPMYIARQTLNTVQLQETLCRK